MAECIIHLNLTSRAMLPLIEAAIAEGRASKLFRPGPYRRDLVGWLVSWMQEPPVRIRIKTTAPFVPAAVEPKDMVLGEFDTLQEELRARIASFPRTSGSTCGRWTRSSRR